MGLRTCHRAFLAAAVLAACATATAPCRGESVVAGAAEPYPYYIEFRVAVNGFYGHSYIVYGRLNASGEPATTTYADIHPTGDMPSMVLGHFIPVHAATMPEKDTLGRKIASRFRRGLTAAEYHRLKLTITRSVPPATPGASSPTIATILSRRWRVALACRRRPHSRSPMISSPPSRRSTRARRARCMR